MLKRPFYWAYFPGSLYSGGLIIRSTFWVGSFSEGLICYFVFLFHLIFLGERGGGGAYWNLTVCFNQLNNKSLIR